MSAVAAPTTTRLSHTTRFIIILQCGAVQWGAVLRGAVRRSEAQCRAAPRRAARCGTERGAAALRKKKVLRHSTARCDARQHGAMRCGVVPRSAVKSAEVGRKEC